MSDTWGASHSLASFSSPETNIVPQGETTTAVVRLRIHALRLPADTIAAHGSMGFATVGELTATPPALLARRFGNEVIRGIDQIFGCAPELLEPVRTKEMVEATKVFGEPIAAADTIAKYICRLQAELSAKLEERGYGMIAYASSFIKCHHSDVFCAALVNSQPKGFYTVAQIIRGAIEHGIMVRPVCINNSRRSNRSKVAAATPSAQA